jgi:hypothetical protein
MSSWRRAWRAVVLASALVGVAMIGPGSAAARAGSGPTMYADLDGQRIPLVDVGDYYCHDLDFPSIHCFSDPEALESAMGSDDYEARAGEYAVVGANAVAGTGVYATVYEYTTYQGSYMHMSQNYTCLACIGWNDRISSYVAKNSQSGNFYTDWFYGGTVYGFCCNQQLPVLGSFDNTFSSVYRF